MFLLRQFNKIKWFINNYHLITKDSRLLSKHFLSPITYDTDSLCTSNNCDFLKEERFIKAYDAALATNPWKGFTLHWRVYIVCWFANLVKNLDGDYVECGVNTGAYSRALIEYTNFNELNKVLYLFDTFEGFPESQISEEEKVMGIQEYGGDHYKNVYEDVRDTFSLFPVEIIKGLVPDTLEKCKAKSICYLSLDMNAVKPEIAAAEFFWPKMVPGGVIILDDYGFKKHINQKLAFDEFARNKNVEILSLPTGQGIIFKP
jgi:O-methyltransferase